MLLINPEIDADGALASLKPLADWAVSVGGLYVFQTRPSWLTFFDTDIDGDVRFCVPLKQKRYLQAHY
jgi:hypothetical protein